MKTASSARQRVKKLARKLQSNGQMQHKADIDMAKKAREVELLERACKAMSLVLCWDPDGKSYAVKDSRGEKWHCEFDEHDYWLSDKLTSVKTLGKTAVFDNPSVYGIKAVKNMFFGVKTAEELAVRLDLMGA